MRSDWWQMSLGPATVGVRTSLALAEAVANWRTSGEEPLFLLEPHDQPNGQARVVHVPVPRERAKAIWQGDAGTACLVLEADDERLSAITLLFLAYLVLESRLHRHGYITLHAAAVARNDRAVLLLGPAGAGKTTTAIRLCQDHGARLVGNDLVVVGGNRPVPMTLAGTHDVRLRHTSIRRTLPHLLDLFPHEVADPWRAKVNIAPMRLGIDIASNPADVSALVFVHVDPDYAQLIDEPGDTLVHRLNLHENALRYIRGSSTPWLVGPDRRCGPYMPSLDDELAHDGRTATLDRLMARARYVAGPLESVAARLSELIDRGPSETGGRT